jgi:putative heme-binding domain-containing protein
LFELARHFAAEEQLPAAMRTAAAGLLGRDSTRKADDLETVERLLSPALPGELQAAAVRAAARTGDAAVPAVLLKGWATHSPSLRIAIADVLLSRQPWTLELAGSPAARDLDFARKQRLLNHGNAEVKKAAKATLDQSTPASADRQKVIEQYQTVLSESGDVPRGKQVYLENCATCHRSGGEGNDIGPSLLSVRDWTKENLLAAILDPDRTVEPRYIAYAVATRDDQSLTGVITNESAAGITIKTLDTKEHQIPRGNIKTFTSTGHSLMPQGFEAALPPKDLADLIGFIRSVENR